MSNNEIIIWIYNNINIDKFVRKVIDTSYIDNSNKDLQQYIYLYLLEYDNDKLNNLYDQKVLPQFIMRIILNQRNYYRSYYNLYLKNFDCNIDGIDLIDEDDEPNDKEKKLIFFNKEIKKYVGKRKNLNKEQEYEMLTLEVYRLYLNRGYTIKELAVRLDLGYRTVFKLIKSAKESIKNNYKK